MALTHGDLFSGIGGFSLAAQRAGIKTLWHSEIDPYASAVLKKHWPDTPNHGDITKLDGTAVEPVDIITAGPPCQPVSLAGKGLGADDDRWLWPDTLRVIGECRPRWVLLENPPALLSRGFGDILGWLAALGYDAEWECIPAYTVGAWHERERIWLVAYRDRFGCDRGAGIFRPDGWPEPANGHWWSSEPDVGRMAYGVPARTHRIRGLGNAIVPQVAEWILGRIVMLDSEHVV